MIWHDKTLERLNQMLDAGIAGTFCESDYNESKLSRLESKWKRYLADSVLAKENLNKEKESLKSLISDISHQTKTPMTNIRMYAELMEESLLKGRAEEGMKLTGELLHQINRLEFLIDSLTKMSRLETGILAVVPERNDMDQMVIDMMEELRVKAENKDIVFNYINLYAEPGMTMAWFDEKWTREALVNVLDNAIKYSPEHSAITIQIKVFEIYAVIIIQDQGMGISEEEQAQIFGRFYRGKNAAGQDGAGIGLYLTRTILEKESGYIKVSSEEGRGAAFSIFLKRENA